MSRYSGLDSAKDRKKRAIKKEIGQVKRKINSLENANSKLHVTINKLKSENDKLKSKQIQYKNMQAKIEVAISKLSYVKGSTGNVHSSIKSAYTGYGNKNVLGDIDEFNSDIGSILTALNKMIAEAKEKIRFLEKQILKNEESIKESEKKIKANENDIARWKNKKTSLTIRLHSLG